VISSYHFICGSYTVYILNFCKNMRALDCIKNEFVKMFQFASTSYSLSEAAFSQLRLGIKAEGHYRKVAKKVRHFQRMLFYAELKDVSSEFERKLLNRFMLVYDGVGNKEQVLCSLLVDVINGQSEGLPSIHNSFLRTLLCHLVEEHQGFFNAFIGSILFENDAFLKQLALLAGYQKSQLAMALFSRLSMFDNKRSLCLESALAGLPLYSYEPDSDSDDWFSRSRLN